MEPQNVGTHSRDRVAVWRRCACAAQLFRAQGVLSVFAHAVKRGVRINSARASFNAAPRSGVELEETSVEGRAAPSARCARMEKLGTSLLGPLFGGHWQAQASREAPSARILGKGRASLGRSCRPGPRRAYHACQNRLGCRREGDSRAGAGSLRLVPSASRLGSRAEHRLRRCLGPSKVASAPMQTIESLASTTHLARSLATAMLPPLLRRCALWVGGSACARVPLSRQPVCLPPSLSYPPVLSWLARSPSVRLPRPRQGREDKLHPLPVRVCGVAACAPTHKRTREIRRCRAWWARRPCFAPGVHAGQVRLEGHRGAATA